MRSSREPANWRRGQGRGLRRGLVAGATGTAGFLLKLFVMLYAMFYFLGEGRGLLDAALHYTPLSEDDKARLLGTFSSVGRATVKGTLIIGIVQGGLAGLSFWVAGIEGVLFWSAMMAVRPLLIGKDTEMPDLLVLLTTLGGLALFGFVGLLVGPLIAARYITVWKLWGSAMDEVPDEVGAEAISS